MKIDRFVRVMLVLIALLLALNCVSSFVNASNSRGNASMATPGSSATTLIENKVEAAPPAVQYTVFDSGGELYAALKELNQRAASGWEYAGSVGNIMIFKK
jgi:hypothetical protein